MPRAPTVDLTCPVCATRFRSRSAPVSERVGQDTDFRPRTSGEDPIPFHVHTCPQCFFAAFEGDFSQPEDSVRQAVIRDGPDAAVLGDEPPGALRGSTKYMLAARWYESDRRATRLRLADLYLRASWCAASEGDMQRERDCQVEAVVRFEAALDEREPAAAQVQAITYLIGELYRRLGRFELAEVMLERAEAYADDGRDERLARLAQNQRIAAREGRSERMVIEL